MRNAATPPARGPSPGRILVFPAGVPAALQFCREARLEGREVIGASSLPFDPCKGEYGAWAYLPYVHEPDFPRALMEVLETHQVSEIYAPHEVAAQVLETLLPRHAPNVSLRSAAPLREIEAAYRDRLEGARQIGPDWLFLQGGRPRMSAEWQVGLRAAVDRIPGMTDDDKIEALFEALRYAPAGDVVEIGSWWGRSAALLLLLSRAYGLGAVLCVDPWRNDMLDQGVVALDRASASMDADFAYAIFQMNLAPLAAGDINVLRAASTKAAGIYRPGLRISEPGFGTTCYEGGISVLHIDGNHALEHVREDAAAWIPLVKPGGWIVIDDYVWAFGDGPRRVADAWLGAHWERVDVAFVMGTALFIRLHAPGQGQ